MKIKVESAVLNNAIWCDMVCGSHGIPGCFTDLLWVLPSSAPPYYPEIITLDKNATMDEIHQYMGAGQIRSVKDSFANLDLSQLGFQVLFTAEWIFHAPLHSKEKCESSWHVVTTENELSQWNLAHASGNVIKPELLGQEDVRIFMQNEGDGVSGFIANLGANAVGISNVFSAGGMDKKRWSEILHATANEFPDTPMVGYERGEDLAAALLAGWKQTGPLRVWLRGR